MSAVYTGETETMKRYGIILTETNLQEYANARGIDAKVKKMNAQDKAILRYLYILDKTKDMQGDFERTSGSWANQQRMLTENFKEFLIVIGNGLVNVLTPLINVLNVIIIKITQFARTIGAVLAQIFGIKAVDIYDEITKSAENAAAAEEDVGDAAASAGKKAKGASAGFDELNVIQQNTGASASSGAPSSIDWGELPGIDDLLDLKEQEALVKLDIDNLYDLGKYLSDTLKNMLKKIDWESIYEGASNFGKGLADFLNGLIQPETFEEIGATLAGVLNTIFHAAFSFVDTFDWKNLGDSLAKGFNRFVEDTDWTLIGKTVHKYLQGVKDAFLKFVKETDWSEVWKAIKDFLSEITFEDIVILAGILTLKSISKFVLGGGVITAIKKGLKLGLEKAWDGVKIGTTKITKWTRTFVGSIKDAFISIGGLKSLFTMDAEYIFGAGTVTEIGVWVATAMIAGLCSAWAGFNLGEWLYVNVFGGAKEYLLSQNWEEFFDFFSMDRKYDDLKQDMQAQYAELRSTMAPAKGALSNAGIAVNDIYNDPKALAEFTETMTHLSNIEFDISNFDEFEEALNRVIGCYGELDDTTIDYLYTLQENYDKLSDVDKLLIDNAYHVGNLTVQDEINGQAQLDNAAKTKQASETAARARKATEDAIKSQTAEYARNATATDNNTAAIERNIKMENLAQNAYERSERAVNATQDAIRQYVEEQGGYVKALDEAYTSTENMAESLQEMGVSSDELSDYLAVLKDEDIPQLNQAASDMVDLLNTNIPTVIDTFQSFANGIKGYLKQIKTYWNGQFAPLFKADALTEMLADVEPTFTTVFTGVANAVIGIINRMIDAINDAMDISWDAVEINGEKVVEAGSAQIISIPNIPALAKGAVLPPNRPFMAMVGDQSNGTNVEAPLTTIQEALVEALNNSAFISLLSEIAQSTKETADKDFSVNIGDRDIARANARGQKSMGVSIINTI
jgi:hypothetical protein